MNIICVRVNESLYRMIITTYKLTELGTAH